MTTATGDSVTAPMQATVVKLAVADGDPVVKGDLVLVLEAMKMEHTTCAPSDGVCQAFKVTVGEQVSEGAELVEFISEPAPGKE